MLAAGAWGWELEPHDEVGGVTGGREGSSSAQYLVDWAMVDAGLWSSSLSDWDEMQQRQVDEELLWL